MRATTKLGAAFVALFASAAASAAPLTLTGNYIEVGISDGGTLGSDNSTSPGLLHDPMGHGNFGINDYITPGTPHDGFSLASDQFGFESNDNFGAGGNFGSFSPSLLVGAAANGYDNAATWSGANDFADITNSYFYNDGDQRIIVKTTITAISDLTGLAFARSVDPDPDVRTFGSFSTNNQRGNSLFGIDDFVGAAGPKTGLTLALINLDTGGFTHSTQINTNCCNNINPFTVLNHTGADAGLSSTGDYGLNLAYNLGSLAAGSSVTLTYAYAYAVGDKIDDVGNPNPGIPEPATWAMMLIGFGFIGATMRRRATKVTFA